MSSTRRRAAGAFLDGCSDEAERQIGLILGYSEEDIRFYMRIQSAAALLNIESWLTLENRSQSGGC